MKRLRLVFPAAIAAFLAIALWGAASASAVTLCKENQKKCPAGMAYAKETVFVLKAASEVVFNAPKLFTARCLGSTFESKTKAESGAPLLGTIPTFTLGVGTPPKCEGCEEIFARALGYNTKFQELTGQWTLTVESGGSGGPGFRLTKCPPGGKEECVYASTSYGLNFTGGNPASLAAAKVSLPFFAGSAEDCGTSIEWTDTYQITEATEPGQKGVANPPVWASEMP